MKSQTSGGAGDENVAEEKHEGRKGRLAVVRGASLVLRRSMMH